MKIAVMAGLFAKRDVDVNACHAAKVRNLPQRTFSRRKVKQGRL